MVLVAQTPTAALQSGFVDATRHSRSKKIASAYRGLKSGRSYTQTRNLETHGFTRGFVSPLLPGGYLYGFVFLSAVDYVLMLLVPVAFDFLAHSFCYVYTKPVDFSNEFSDPIASCQRCCSHKSMFLDSFFVEWLELPKPVQSKCGNKFNTLMGANNV